MGIEVNQDAIDELKAQLTPINGIKIIFGTLISVGAAAAVVAAFREPIKGSKGIFKILMAAGVFVLGCKAGDVAEDYFKQTVDDLTETVTDISNEVKKLEGVEKANGTNSRSGRDTKQQPEEQASVNGVAEATGKTAGSSIWRRWRGEKKGTEQVLEMDAKDVSERQKPEGHHEGNPRKPGDTGG